VRSDRRAKKKKKKKKKKKTKKKKKKKKKRASLRSCSMPRRHDGHEQQGQRDGDQ
jgi:hypothetical protein